MNGNNSLEKAKVLFPLQPDEHGYPPVNVESLWAVLVDDLQWEIVNTPFFVKDISYGDVVYTELKEGELWFQSTSIKSEHSTIRIIIYEDHQERLEAILQDLEQFGCSWEQGHVPLLIAVDVPPDVDIDEFFEHLDSLEEAEIATFEVGTLRH